ncbi:hypothetical protein FLAG1_07684 [Fusarium langsethiae]|uniref:PNPLA domain-containing protein n=1 Tax=Fusarium langsethiae TaxID=179993 RepID=A0A0N0DDC1_FUSLA|nr:hypothetical protein FLAG1_07684 [Fusarium langsethiae]
MVLNGTISNKRWMTISEQSGSLSVQLTPLLAECLDNTPTVPSMTLLIGSPAATELADQLGTSLSAGEVLLDVDPKTKSLQVSCSTALKHVDAQDHRIGDSIPWARASKWNDYVSLANVYARLLGPFCHVVCVFAPSFTSTAEMGNFLSSWLQSILPMTQTFAAPYSTTALPRLVVLTEERRASDKDFLSDLKASLQAIVVQQTGLPLTRAFSSISVKRTLTEAGLLRNRRYTKTTTLLESECTAARRHFERFNMIYDANTSRAWNPLPSNAIEQITNFLSDFKDKDENALPTFVFPYLISAMHANAYPYASHPYPFPLLFETLYKSVWLEAAGRACLNSDMCLLFERMVKDSKDNAAVVDTADYTKHTKTSGHVARLDAANLLERLRTSRVKLKDGGMSPKPQNAKPSGVYQERSGAHLKTPMSPYERHHLLSLSTFRDRWRLHKVHDYCPACILRRPEYGLPCGHMYCEYDIKLVGRKTGDETYAVDSCICCQARFVDVVFRFRPKTRGVSVLALDGGGVRGVMMLKGLQMLQERLWKFLPGIPIIELFDICTGTSTGGICLLTLAHKGISVDQAIQDFINLSQRVFVAHPVWARLLKLVARGSVYASKAIDEPLKSHYGESTLSDYTPATARAAKLLVTVTGTPDGDHILSNFNGVGLQTSKSQFKETSCQQSEAGKQRIFAWEAGFQSARCTASASFIFPPFTMDGFGTFQDGALWRNNPMAVALPLLPVLCPGLLLPDFVLSIGTGCEARTHEGTSASCVVTRRNFVAPQVGIARKLFPLLDVIGNVIESTCHNLVMDGEKYYNHLVNEVCEPEFARRCRRLNVKFSEACPPLDDAASLSMLIKTATEQFAYNPVILESVETLISSRFYFEISSRPVRREGHIVYCGRILCIVQPDNVLHHFIKTLKACRAQFLMNGKVVALEGASEWNGRDMDFELPVQGTVESFQTPLDIFLCWNMEGKYKRSRISLSPFTLARIMETQGWDSPPSRAQRRETAPRPKRKLDCHKTWRDIKKART